MATLMMRNRVSAHGTTMSMLGSPDHLRKRHREKMKANPKGPEEHFLAKNQHKILNGGQNRTLLGGSKERKARKACQKGNDGFRKGGFSPLSAIKNAGEDYTQNKGKGKDQEGKGNGSANPQSRLSASETPDDKNMACLGIGRLVFQPVA